MEIALTYAVLALVLLALLVAMIFRTRPTRRGVLLIDPVLGALNLQGPWIEDMIAEDVEALTPYFTAVRSRKDVPPSCDVLLLYCEINSSGELQNSPKPANEIIRDAGASIVIIATNNPAEHYSAMPKGSFGSVNLVMTIDRRGQRFASFLARLFAQMNRGDSIGHAWIKIAPQIPGTVHEDLPTTICSLDLK